MAKAATGYTQSDEITLVFSLNGEKSAYPFDGKVQKLSSLIASYTGVRFNYHLMREKFEPGEEELKARVEAMEAHFDARVFNVPFPGEALNNLMWRSLFDCRRNSVSALGHKNYSTKQLHGLGTTALKKKLLEEKGIDWEKEPDWFKFGTYVKKVGCTSDWRKRGLPFFSLSLSLFFFFLHLSYIS
jgi:tRNA(His) guanylyltransferase